MGRKRFLPAFLFFLLTATVYADRSPLDEGFDLLEQRKYSAAFLQFSSIRQKDSHAYAGMGMARYFSRNYPGAVIYLNRSMQSSGGRPNWSVPYFAGLSLYEAGDYRRALPYFTRALELNNLPDIRLYMGSALANLKEYSQAEAYLLGAIEQDPRFLRAYLELFKIYETRRQLENSRKLLEIARNTIGDNPHLTYQRARLYFMQGEMELAEKELNKAMNALSSREAQGLYSSIRQHRAAGKSQAPGTRPAGMGLFSFLAGGLAVLAALLYLLWRARRAETRKKEESKEESLDELLKTGDLETAEEILVELIHKKVFDDRMTMSQIKLACIKGDYARGLELSAHIEHRDFKLFVQGLMLLFLDDRQRFEDHLELLRKEELHRYIQMLRSHSLEDIAKLLRTLLDLQTFDKI